MAATIFTQTFESALFGRIRTLVEQEAADGQVTR